MVSQISLHDFYCRQTAVEYLENIFFIFDYLKLIGSVNGGD